MTNVKLKKRILEISYKKGLSHIGSCITAVDIIKDIYDIKKPNEKFVLSSGHAGLALYVVLESKEGRNAEEIFDHHGVHPDRCNECGIDYSTGSLGQGLPAAVGMAFANRKKNVYCLLSDGECSEGSIWEALRIKKQQKLDNLKVYLNWNGWGAYGRTDWITWKMIEDWEEDGIIVCDTKQEIYPFPFLDGQDAHYHVLTKEEYEHGIDLLS